MDRKTTRRNTTGRASRFSVSLLPMDYQVAGFVLAVGLVLPALALPVEPAVLWLYGGSLSGVLALLVVRALRQEHEGALTFLGTLASVIWWGALAGLWLGASHQAVASLILPMVAFGILLRRLLKNESVSFNEEGITRRFLDGKCESVRWDDLVEIGIVTSDDGPWTDDVVWLFFGSPGGCAVPSETRGMSELLPRLQTLPGFDNEAVIEAMGCTDNNRFVVWRKSST